MATNPIENNEFRFFLKFKDFNDVWYETPEWIGFDGLKFVTKQTSDGYAKDINYILEDVRFVDTEGKTIDTPQIVNPQGDISYRLDYALEWWFYALKEKGFEASVEGKITKNNVDFKIYEADLTAEDTTDGKTYVKVKWIDNGKVMAVRRRLDNRFNFFDTADVDGNVIEPMPSFNYLRRSTAIQNESFGLCSNYLHFLLAFQLKDL